MMNPTQDRVILKPIPPETKTKTGLIIPDTAQKVEMWEVVATGPQIANKIQLVGDRVVISQNPEINIRPGMVVMIPQECGVDYEEDGQKYRVIRYSTIDLFDEKQ